VEGIRRSEVSSQKAGQDRDNEVQLRAFVKEDALKPVKPKPQPTPASDQAPPLCEHSPHEESPPWRQVVDRRIAKMPDNLFNRPVILQKQYCAGLLSLRQDSIVAISSNLAQNANEVVFQVLVSQAFLDIFYSPFAICVKELCSDQVPGFAAAHYGHRGAPNNNMTCFT
jgi:hypothetical protein